MDYLSQSNITKKTAGSLKITASILLRINQQAVSFQTCVHHSLTARTVLLVTAPRFQKPCAFSRLSPRVRPLSMAV
jgi:hypothetical protein